MERLQRDRPGGAMIDASPAATASPPPYLMDSRGEGRRLERKTRAAPARRQLAAAGLVPGMRSLDVGCGTGAVTRVMAGVAGPGRATGVDASPERIAQARQLAEARGVEAAFACHDACALDLPDGAFDFVWSRFLFEYLLEPQRALAEMVRVTRPGGTVAVADLDGQLQTFQPLDEADAACLAGVLRAMRAAGFDPDVGRKLYGWCRAAGLVDVRARVFTHQLYAGGIPPRERPNWRDKVRTAVPRLSDLDGPASAAMERLGALIERDDLFYYSTLILVTGRVPG